MFYMIFNEHFWFYINYLKYGPLPIPRNKALEIGENPPTRATKISPSNRKSLNRCLAFLSCGHCIKAIEGSVEKLPRVNTVKENLDSGTVEVEFNPDMYNNI
ncbi:cation transporter [Peribacillus sp. Bi134]|uniref:cation transporter n=1 Tax=Peribacillus sp. Bi134 TaxID=2884272 RepID=UPI001D5E9256|nr:Copper chaperone CopZ [Peribacillus sp. Bi134]